MIRDAAEEVCEVCWARPWSQYFISHDKELRLPIKDLVSLKGLQKRNDKIQFVFLRVYLGCCVKDKLEGDVTGDRKSNSETVKG